MTLTRPHPVVAVVGGGPGGLMAAEVLANAGCAVTVYEHMPSVGRKLLLAGRGGLNITHSEPIERFVQRYGTARPIVEPALLAFSPGDLRAWCADLGEETFVGSSGRVFPSSFRATPLLRAWLHRLARLGVRIEVRHRWLGWERSSAGTVQPTHVLISDANGDVAKVEVDATVFSLGGASWPKVGSDGGWTDLFAEAGVEVSPLRSANCGVTVEWPPSFAERFAGVPLKNVAVSVGDVSVRGDAMITRYGLEGGPIYAHTTAIRNELDRTRQCVLTFDLQPDLSIAQLTERLGRARPKDSVSTTLRRAAALTPSSVALLRAAFDGSLPSAPAARAAAVKSAPVLTRAMEPLARAISTSGGIRLSEIDETFMLRHLPGTFVAGEMLDWEAPTGGYLLQATFSTARVAAHAAAAYAHAHAHGRRADSSKRKTS